MGWPTRTTFVLQSLSPELDAWYFIYRLALSGTVSISFWSPPRGVSTIASGLSHSFILTSAPNLAPVPSHSPVPTSSPSPQYLLPTSPSPPSLSPSSPPHLPTPPVPPPPSSPHVAQPPSRVSFPIPDFRAPITPPPAMPSRNDPIAPIFDSQKPRELRRYFCDLEFLLSRSHVTGDFEKKSHATRFLSIDDQDLWESIPEFNDPAASFAQFTAAIFRLYPEADPDRRYSLADLEALVTELSHVPSLSRARFLEFYRRFFTISSFLCSRDRLSIHEQSRTFIRAIPLHIWQLARQRLEVKCPDVHPDDPYSLHDLCDAVDFILLTSCTTTTPISVSSPELPAPAPADSSLAALANVVNELTRLVSSQQPFPAALRPDLQPIPSPHPTLCSYCSDPAHLIACCPVVAADIHSGFCKRNAEGKVVLPSGSFVPHRLAGPNLRARIVSWYAANPPRSASPVASHASAPMPFLSHAPASRPRESTSHFPHSAVASGSMFKAENHLAELQAQLNALRSQAHTTVVASQSQSMPSQPASHRPLPSQTDFASVYVQQQQHINKIDTHGFPAPPFAPPVSHHTPASQIAPQSDFARVLCHEKSFTPCYANPPSRTPHAVPHVVSPPFPREQESQSSSAELAHVPEPQSRPVLFQKSFPVLHTNSEIFTPTTVPHVVSPPFTCEQEPQLSPIELCRVSEAQSHFADSQIPFGADSTFQKSYPAQSTVQCRPQCSRSSSSDLLMSQPHPASHSQLQLNNFAPEISPPAHRDFTASFRLAHNSSVVPRNPDLVSSRPSSPADLISFD
ncbi:hypothetical protein MSAN_02357600 [Mycena sanguinolenta]|uniref:Uncharacterized protein n=1 Tax=Mycena sanguinolenta TaxID=230812 RepID=A0A8H6X695_9AGAR|nr:hypothetical protein MSAN_02357600 [Mycena sanguinolenta]